MSEEARINELENKIVQLEHELKEMNEKVYKLDEYLSSISEEKLNSIIKDMESALKDMKFPEMEEILKSIYSSQQFDKLNHPRNQQPYILYKNAESYLEDARTKALKIVPMLTNMRLTLRRITGDLNDLKQLKGKF